MKTKKRVGGSRSLAEMADAASDIPNGGLSEDSACGHGSCGASCRVRYVGPTSSMRDHHILHAARGATHVWSAAIISGLAVVVTGVFAYSSVQARESTARVSASPSEHQHIIERFDKMEKKLEMLQTSCDNALEYQTASTTAAEESALGE